jgi:hypothetical protein
MPHNAGPPARRDSSTTIALPLSRGDTGGRSARPTTADQNDINMGIQSMIIVQIFMRKPHPRLPPTRSLVENYLSTIQPRGRVALRYGS